MTALYINFAEYFEEASAADNGAHREVWCVATESEILLRLLASANEVGSYAEELVDHTDSLRRAVLKRLSQIDNAQSTNPKTGEES